MATVKIPPGRKILLQIPNGQSSTDVIDLGAGPASGSGYGSYRRWDAQIIALAGIHTGTVNPQISDTETVVGNFRNMQSGGADILIAANKATPIIPIVGRFFRLLSSGGEAADRNFIVMLTTITNER